MRREAEPRLDHHGGRVSYHFIGMGGIGMSALARVLLQQGKKVQGSDIRASTLLDALECEGAKVEIGQSGQMISEGDTVVYSSDIASDNVEMRRAMDLHLPLLHRSELLNALVGDQLPLLVTGTHGKTTSSALLASVLLEGGMDPSFVIGGLIRPMNTNGRAGRGPYFVAEADESDGSFLKTAAYASIVTNLEEEHLNYWKTPEKLFEAFREFFHNTKQCAVWCIDDEGLRRLSPRGISYGFSDGADWQISRFCTTRTGLSFDLSHGKKSYRKIDLALYGRHNALNAAAVFVLALQLGVSEEAIRRAFLQFGGAARRLEWLGSAQQIDLYDDYGHHPSEIKATLSALRMRIRERRLVVLFQPHRYSRVRDLFEEFLNCFDEADELIMTDIYSAGEAPIEGICSASLYMRLREKLGAKVRFFSRQHLEHSCAAMLMPGDSVLTLGAGDITACGKILLEKIRELKPQLKVGVLFGGVSPEHNVSLMSAQNILNAIDRSIFSIQSFGVTKEGDWIVGDEAMEQLKKKLLPNRSRLGEVLERLKECDVCFPVFHGPQGEDGMIQGLLETLVLAYVGCDYRASAICMQKAWTKQMAMLHGIPTANFVDCSIAQWKENPDSVCERVKQFPVWVKPVHLGSSIGVSRVLDKEELQDALSRAFSLDDALIVEQEIVGRQIEFAVLGNDFLRVGEPGEILNHGEFYDYERKYGSSPLMTKTPADLSEIEREVGQDLAVRAYRACGCAGLARVDFFLDRSGHYWLNEINPMPGFTSISLYPKMWEAAGMSQQQLCSELIVLALHRRRHLASFAGTRV